MFDGKAKEALMMAQRANETASAATAAATAAMASIDKHSAVCAERQAGIATALGGLSEGQKEVKKFLGSVMKAIIVGLIAIIGFGVEQIANHHGWFGQ